MQIVRRINCMAAALAILAAPYPGIALTSQQQHRSAPDAIVVWKALDAWHMGDAKRLIDRLGDGPDRRCAEGVVASRDNRVRASVRLLEHCSNDAGLRPIASALSGEALMDAYGKMFDYGAQARTGEELLRLHSSPLSDNRRKDVQADLAMATALARAGTSPQTMSGHGPVRLATRLNAMGTIEANLVGNGLRASWMIDTGANYSVLTEGLAKRMGIVPLEARVDVGDSREKTSTVRLGVIRTLDVGSLAFRNVVSFIVPDDALRVKIGGKVERIEAVLGHPVLSRLGRVTFDAAGSMTGDPAAPLLNHGGRIYMRLLTPLLEARTVGQSALFGLDTGANVTSLFAPFARALPGGVAALSKENRQTVGISSSGTDAEGIVPELHLGIGDDVATIRHVGVDAEHGKTDPRFGNIGLDILNGRSSMTIDYRSMRFSLGNPTHH